MQKIKAIGHREAWKNNWGTLHIIACHILAYSSSINHIEKTRGPKNTNLMSKIPEECQESTPKISFHLELA